MGAVAVHCANGIWGTIAEGLFSTSEGLFYGGGATHLAVQCLGVVSIGGYTLAVMFLVYKFIDATVGLRVTAEEEIMGPRCHRAWPDLGLCRLPAGRAGLRQRK